MFEYASPAEVSTGFCLCRLVSYDDVDRYCDVDFTQSSSITFPYLSEGYACAAVDAKVALPASPATKPDLTASPPCCTIANLSGEFIPIEAGIRAILIS